MTNSASDNDTIQVQPVHEEGTKEHGKAKDVNKGRKGILKSVPEESSENSFAMQSKEIDMRLEEKMKDHSKKWMAMLINQKEETYEKLGEIQNEMMKMFSGVKETLHGDLNEHMGKMWEEQKQMRKEQEKMASMMGSLWQMMRTSKHSETNEMEKRTVTPIRNKPGTNAKLETMSAKERGLDKYHRGESPRPHENQSVESGDEL